MIKEGVVGYTGERTSLKRFEEDGREVSKGYDFVKQIMNYRAI
ncbi:hypothetical protein [Gelidibacter sp.]